MRDQHRQPHHGESAAGVEEPEPVHVRRGRRSRLQLAAEEGLLPALRPLGALQEPAGQRSAAVAKETVG